MGNIIQGFCLLLIRFREFLFAMKSNQEDKNQITDQVQDKEKQTDKDDQLLKKSTKDSIIIHDHNEHSNFYVPEEDDLEASNLEGELIELEGDPLEEFEAKDQAESSKKHFRGRQAWHEGWEDIDDREREDLADILKHTKSEELTSESIY